MDATVSGTELTWELGDYDATLYLGECLGRSLAAGTTLLLQGELGAGKTTLTQGIGLGLGITEPVVSPTFTLVNEYHDGRIPLYHFDLYRLTPDQTDVLNLPGYWEGSETPLGLVVIEWAERLNSYPEAYFSLHLSDTSLGRQAKMTWVGDIDLEMVRSAVYPL
jgi:tRNA threonylcarbamoyladenosine biosynthesis protein TsaE